MYHFLLVVRNINVAVLHHYHFYSVRYSTRDLEKYFNLQLRRDI